MNSIMRLRRWNAAVVIVAYLVSTAAPLGAQQEQGEPAVGLEETEEIPTWPRQIDADFGTVVIYQPQLESFTGDKLESRSAVSVTLTGESQPIFGAVWIEARLHTDTDERVVYLESVKVTAAKFPDKTDEEVAALSRYLEQEIPKWELELSLDRLIAGMEALEGTGSGVSDINTEPPEIIYATEPTVLIVIDGEPILAELENTDLKYVANSAYYILQEPKSKRYYLKGGEHWYASTDLKGSWEVTTDLPGEVGMVAEEIRKEEEKQAAEAAAAAAEAGTEESPPEDVGDPGEIPIPRIVFRTAPAEIIEVDGAPAFVPVEGTELLYMENTENDVLMVIESQLYYVLLAGRWYASDSMTGHTWKYVAPDELPADFAKIPADSDVGTVLVSVAGTQEAKEAVLENSIPQTAEVDRKTATVEVTYDGDPQFESCADNVAYAINTDKSVLLVGNTYYCCDEAIWFLSNGPEGPWEVATSVPPEIQDIPADCPVHNVKYVYIYESTPEVVYVGYTPAYLSSYVYRGCVVYGTGYWYRPWYGHYYYPRPCTYGYGVHWNPYSGWGFSFGISFGWIGIGWGRPMYGGWWGVGGYRWGYRAGYHGGYRHAYHRGYRHGARAGYRAGYRHGSSAGRPGHHSNNMYKGRDHGVRRTGGSSPGGARPSSRDVARAQPATGGRDPGRTGTTRPSTGLDRRPVPEHAPRGLVGSQAAEADEQAEQRLQRQAGERLPQPGQLVADARQQEQRRVVLLEQAAVAARAARQGCEKPRDPADAAVQKQFQPLLLRPIVLREFAERRRRLAQRWRWRKTEVAGRLPREQDRSTM